MPIGIYFLQGSIIIYKKEKIDLRHCVVQAVGQKDAKTLP